jgi:hypothetical protein
MNFKPAKFHRAERFAELEWHRRRREICASQSEWDNDAAWEDWFLPLAKVLAADPPEKWPSMSDRIVIPLEAYRILAQISAWIDDEAKRAADRAHLEVMEREL